MAEDQPPSLSNIPTTDSRADVEEAEDLGNPTEIGPIVIIPEVRKCGIVQFKNRFNATEEGIYAVDALESDSFLGIEIQEELKIRQISVRDQAKTRGKNAEPASKLITRNVRVGKSDPKIITRIRIQSPALLSILSKVMKEAWDGRPRTFLRPFAPLISFHSLVCEVLRDLEIKWQEEGGRTEATRTPDSRDETGSKKSDEARFFLDDSAAALADLRCYVQFMSLEVIPLYHQFENLDETSNAKVRFQDLWFLFRVGELVYRPCGTGADKEIDNLTLGNRHWRIYGTRPSWPKYRMAASDNNRNYINDDDSEMASFGVHCYYIDYTGDEFCIVTETFELQPYEGERPIKALKVFPHRFLTNHHEKLKASSDFGKMFLRSLETRHASYNWWTTTLDPRGKATTDTEGKILQRPEYVDSEVIVDFVEAFQACPSWRPVPSILKPEEPSISTTFDDFYINWWSDSDRTKLLAETTEIVVLRSGVTTWERNKNLMEDEFLASIRENDKNNTLTTTEYIRECDLPLLPARLFAYVLRDRKFVQLDVQRLNTVKESNDVFDCLKIPDSHKEIIQSLVEDHFLKKVENKKDGVERLSLDWVKGKGKGLFILLHGVPGVGKTATAEAVAQASGKPLFAITCGDLGLTPSEVESALHRIFRLANTWDCVLLLDEVDTFFSQRSKGDATLTKNVLVSVFLRVLEYYDGLLFLTTNRPGSLDEAFRSRIHLTLYYPPLSFQQTMDIWKLNIDRLRKVERERCESRGHELLKINEHEIIRFAQEKFNQDRSKFRWNGRQIRNAFQIASSLAHFDARKDGIQPRLTADHFKMIHKVTEDFDDFMQEAKGKTDGQLAFDRGDRADHWGHEEGKPEGIGMGMNSYETMLSPSEPRFSGGSGFGQRSTYSQRRQSLFRSQGAEPSNNNFQGLRSVSPRGFQQRSDMTRTPSITFNNGPHMLVRDSDHNTRREPNERSSEAVYIGEDSEYVSPDSATVREGSGGRPESWKREREWPDPETQIWLKRRKESD